jgi:putative tryptophan/tyrosine transport system substrate-binding protein
VTSTIPIVFTSVNDPVEDGLVASLARPGGNLTGFSILTAEVMPKRLELLSELVPQARMIALLVNPNNPNAEPTIRNLQEAARAKGVQLPILKASSESEIDAAFATLVQLQAGALSSPAIHSSISGSSSSWRWHHAMPFRRSTLRANSPWKAA